MRQVNCNKRVPPDVCQRVCFKPAVAVVVVHASWLLLSIALLHAQEYDLVQEPGLTAKQRLLKQKEALKRRLGARIHVLAPAH
jgi:hypothetical protein